MTGFLRWTRGLVYALLPGFAVGVVLALFGLILRNDDLLALGLGVAALWTLVVLLIAAIFGGQTLGRFGHRLLHHGHPAPRAHLDRRPLERRLGRV
ncbi:hypothetical protein [Leifsonia sp. C5G2]|uniref:hypothetical protein n=1 Tax=Leifsonia sp. C5G2 TaxID=2735269 RepID=UPI0015851031|nr:hypothetical protein [Leifsonia sp. C5G2]NUU06420.1 hypothetical protein [Leifsonia sp. C5G2]